MENKFIIKQTIEYVKKKLSGECTGHDWWHTYRVWQMAIKISNEEGDVDLFVVQLAALLHDVADWKFHSGDDSVGQKLAKEWLEQLGVDKKIISHVCEIIKEVSFKGAGVKSKVNNKEEMVVQDADRLDALGAIGIARVFAFGGSRNREIYNPNVKPKIHKTFEEYKKAKTSSINHFYEKILILKNLINTESAKKIAKKRNKFTEEYINRFLKEWELKD